MYVCIYMYVYIYIYIYIHIKARWAFFWYRYYATGISAAAAAWSRGAPRPYPDLSSARKEGSRAWLGHHGKGTPGTYYFHWVLIKCFTSASSLIECSLLSA